MAKVRVYRFNDKLALNIAGQGTAYLSHSETLQLELAIAMVLDDFNNKIPFHKSDVPTMEIGEDDES